MRRKLLLIGLCNVLLAVVVFGVVSWQLLRTVSMINSTVSASLQDVSLSFLRDVIGFNVTEYKVVGSSFAPQTDVASSNGLPLVLISYDLESPQNQVHVDLFYTEGNNTYMLEPYFHISSDTLFYPAYPTDKVLNWTKGFLERYQSFKNDSSYVSEMHKALDTVDHIQPLNITSGNITLQIKIRQFNAEEIYTTLKFQSTDQNMSYPEKAVTFEFHNGAMMDFSDWYQWQADN